MMKLKVSEKVERPTEWVNSIVIARKTNGKLRGLGTALLQDGRPLAYGS